jgi:3-deoxy-D-manno-octulosonate 8-phosphate phosphatase KdsC-like HAD superfamily phosphatase
MPEGKARPWLLAIDLDGNLHVEDEAARTLLRGLRTKGLRRLAFATAHPKNGVRVRRLGAFYEMDCLVLENGSVVLARNGQGWAEVPSWFESHRRTRQALDGLRRDLLQGFEVVERRPVDYTNPPMEVKTVRAPGGEGLLRFEECAHSIQITSKESPVFQHALAFIRTRTARLGTPVNEVIDATSVTYGLASKGEGVRFVSNMGDGQLFTVAMGDSFNDLTMLSTCDLPCAPANAQAEVKKLVQSRGGILASAERIEGVKEVLRLLTQRAPQFRS